MDIVNKTKKETKISIVSRPLVCIEFFLSILFVVHNIPKRGLILCRRYFFQKEIQGDSCIRFWSFFSLHVLQLFNKNLIGSQLGKVTFGMRSDFEEINERNYVGIAMTFVDPCAFAIKKTQIKNLSILVQKKKLNVLKRVIVIQRSK